jgi:hypothetical protein
MRVHSLAPTFFFLDIPHQSHLLNGPHGVIETFLHLKDLEVLFTFLVKVTILLSLLDGEFSLAQARHGLLVFG